MKVSHLEVKLVNSSIFHLSNHSVLMMEEYFPVIPQFMWMMLDLPGVSGCRPGSCLVRPKNGNTDPGEVESFKKRIVYWRQRVRAPEREGVPNGGGPMTEAKALTFISSLACLGKGSCLKKGTGTF